MRSHLTINLDQNSQLPVFEQLAQELENAIFSGRIEAGEMLPSSREFARSLLIARGTVVRAYAILTSKKLVRGFKGKGLIVCKSASTGTVLPKLSEVAIDTYEQEDGGNGGEKSAGAGVEDVTKAAVPLNLLPIKRWRELVLTHGKHIGRSYQTDDAQGPIDLRVAVSRYLAKTRDVSCSPEQISVYTNTDQALDTIARLLIKPGDTVVVEEPGYIGVSNIFAASGAKVIANGIDDGGMAIDNILTLPSPPKVLYATPISQDPTGVVMTEERQYQLIDWSKKNDCVIVEDSWDTDYWHGRVASSCMQQKAPDQIIYLYSFWKVLFPLSNACFLVVPPRMVATLRRLRSMINRPTISIELLALTDLIASGEIEKLTEKLQKSYRKRRQALIYNLATNFKKLIQIDPVGGGTHVKVRFQFPIEKQRLLAIGAECGLKIISLDEYYFDGRTSDWYLIYFTNVSVANIGEQLENFKERLVELHKA
jgi:GntR family transcriptional regulator/MocR family aminotransferase